MNWAVDKLTRRAVSDCGNYLVTWDFNDRRVPYFNAWFVADGRQNLAGSYKKQHVKDACERHRVALENPKQPRTAA